MGWVNYSIQNTSPDGAWHKLERGEVKLDPNWFSDFNRDFQHTHLWEAFQAQLAKKSRLASTSSATTSTGLPPLPKLDAEYLFWEMMRVSRNPDPYMFPALKKLKDSGLFIMGALSNTTILPENHELTKRAASEEVKQFFDFFVSSAHTGLRKPDPKIYAFALKEINDAAKKKGVPEVNPEDVIFLDDIGINLKWAKKAGMGTIKVNLGKTQDAVKELETATGLKLLDVEDKARL